MSLRPVTEETKGKRKREHHPKAKTVNMVNLDPRDDVVHNESFLTNPMQAMDSSCLQPEGKAKTIQVGDSVDQTVKIGNSLSADLEQQLIKLPQDNKNLFAWTTTDMLRVDPNFCCHHLNVHLGTKPIAQKKRKIGTEQPLSKSKNSWKPKSSVKSSTPLGFPMSFWYWKTMANGECVQSTLTLTSIAPKTPSYYQTSTS